MATRRFLVLCTAWAVTAQASELATGAEWEEDDACPAGAAPESCALSLRQLRARGAVAAPVAPHAEEQDEPEVWDDPEGNATGVPGGWGEGATYATEDATQDGAVVSAQGWGSCASYGCLSYYHRGHGCQCNSGCHHHGNCCGDYWSRCYHQGQQNHPQPAPAPAPGGSYGHRTMTLYHQTSPGACDMILRSNFRPGREGWCGGGIYFATSADATNTKAVGPDSHKGCILQATVDVGRVMYLDGQCHRWRSHGQGFDSVSFNPGDGQEYVVYSSSRVLHIQRYR